MLLHSRPSFPLPPQAYRKSAMKRPNTEERHTPTGANTLGLSPWKAVDAVPVAVAVGLGPVRPPPPETVWPDGTTPVSLGRTTVQVDAQEDGPS